MEPIESSETSAYNNTLTPGTYPKEKKLQSKHGESLKSRICNSLLTLDVFLYDVILRSATIGWEYERAPGGGMHVLKKRKGTSVMNRT